MEIPDKAGGLVLFFYHAGLACLVNLASCLHFALSHEVAGESVLGEPMF